MSNPIRTATVSRETSETSITCSLTLDVVPGVDKQEISVSTGIGFLDHVSYTFGLAAFTTKLIYHPPIADVYGSC